MRESAIERYLVKRVKEAGGETRKVKWIGRRGAPDRIVMFPSFKDGLWNHRYSALGGIWVEVKRPGGIIEPHQEREHTLMRHMGLSVITISSMEMVDKFVGVYTR